MVAIDRPNAISY